jgi:hypothetical protein
MKHRSRRCDEDRNGRRKRHQMRTARIVIRRWSEQDDDDPLVPPPQVDNPLAADDLDEDILAALNQVKVSTSFEQDPA